MDPGHYHVTTFGIDHFAAAGSDLAASPVQRRARSGVLQRDNGGRSPAPMPPPPDQAEYQ